MIEQIFQKELILIRQMHQKIRYLIFVIIGILKTLVLNMNYIFAMIVMV